MRIPLQISIAAAMVLLAATAQAQMRFQGMDTNKDGVITRAEWRGNDTSFRNQDWNQDGILSGDEVRTGARRQTSWNQDWNRDGRIDSLDSQIAQRFRGYDTDSDNRVARSEWVGDARLFRRLDTTRDGYLSMEEYTQGGGFTLDSEGGSSSRYSNNDDNYSPAQFNTFDGNRDGWLTRPESRMRGDEFDRFDVNKDNRISRFEFDTVANASSPSSSYDRFATVDLNQDGSLARSEWRGQEDVFTRLDRNRDNRLSRTEYDSEVTNDAPRSAAWRSGFDRGTQEGRVAGRQDYTRRQGWDLEGQRELERADSGYAAQIGSMSDYQTGYREGFRSAYRAAFTDAGGKAPK